MVNVLLGPIEKCLHSVSVHGHTVDHEVIRNTSNTANKYSHTLIPNTADKQKKVELHSTYSFSSYPRLKLFLSQKR